MIAEYKIRVSLTEWKNTPVIARFACDITVSHDDAVDQATEHAVDIADTVEREVRWNWQGSLQGHYVGSGYRLKAASV